MNIKSLLALAATFFIASADEEGKHQRPCGNRCTKEEALKVVLALQEKLQVAAQTCDFLGALELSLPNASFATTDPYCGDGSCCADVGSMEKWWTYYACTDSITYMVDPVDIQHLNNGTIVISKPELTAALNSTLYAFKTSYYWSPVASEKGCDYRLSYITGNSYNCPAYIPNARMCDAPECVNA